MSHHLFTDFRDFAQSNEPSTSCAVNDRGSVAALGTDDGKVWLYRFPFKKPQLLIELAIRRSVDALTFTNDHLAVYQTGGHLSLWDYHELNCLYSISFEHDCHLKNLLYWEYETALALIFPHGSFLVTANTLKRRREILEIGDNPRDAACAGKSLAILTATGSVAFYADARSPALRPTTIVTGMKDATALFLTPRGLCYVVSPARILILENFRPLHIVPSADSLDDTSAWTGAAAVAGERLAAVTNVNGRFWITGEGRKIPCDSEDMGVMQGGKVLYSGDPTCVFANGVLNFQVRGIWHPVPVFAPVGRRIVASCGHELFLAAAADGRISLTNLASAEQNWLELPQFFGRVSCLAADGSQIIAGSSLGQVVVFNLKTFDIAANFAAAPTCAVVAIFCLGDKIAVVDSTNALAVFDKGGKRLLRIRPARALIGSEWDMDLCTGTLKFPGFAEEWDLTEGSLKKSSTGNFLPKKRQRVIFCGLEISSSRIVLNLTRAKFPVIPKSLWPALLEGRLGLQGPHGRALLLGGRGKARDARRVPTMTVARARAQSAEPRAKRTGPPPEYSLFDCLRGVWVDAYCASLAVPESQREVMLRPLCDNLCVEPLLEGLLSSSAVTRKLCSSHIRFLLRTNPDVLDTKLESNHLIYLLAIAALDDPWSVRDRLPAVLDPLTRLTLDGDSAACEYFSELLPQLRLEPAASARLLTTLCESPKPKLLKVLGRIAAMDLVGFVHFGLTMARKAQLHALEILPIVIRENSRRVLANLDEFSEALLRCIDPHDQRLRRNCVAAVTLALNALVQACPMAAFNKTSQKFGIGDIHGFVHVFDLRTASRSRKFAGHLAAVSAVSFDKEGGRIASYSAGDATLRVWSCAPTSFLGGLLGQGAAATVVRELPGGPKQPLTHPLALATPLDAARLRWADSGDLWLHREDGSEQKIIT